MPPTQKYRGLLFYSVLNGWILLSLIAVIEGALEYSLNKGVVPKIFLRAYRSYYLDYDWNIIQYDTKCATYDPALTYLYRQGECKFANREFDTKVRINSHGFRDTGTKIEDAEMVVLGDSHAFGWGVEGEESFPELLQRRLNVAVFNAAVSSYGTAREYLALKRLSPPKARWIVLEYNDGDFNENKSFLGNGFKLEAMSRTEYDAIVSFQRERLQYKFPQHFLRLLPRLFYLPYASGSIIDGPGKIEYSEPPYAEHLEALGKIAALILDSAKEARVLIFQVNDWNRNIPEFERALSDQLDISLSASDRARVFTLDTSGLLTDDDYFRLDVHMKPSGHMKVAEGIANKILSIGLN